MNKLEHMASGTERREIPTPPGGGSWTFDEASWQWVSNHPTAATEPAIGNSDAQRDVADNNQSNEE